MTRSTLFPHVAFVYPLVVLVCPVLICPLVVRLCSLIVRVCSLVVSVCPLVVLAVLSVGLFITDHKNPFFFIIIFFPFFNVWCHILSIFCIALHVFIENKKSHMRLRRFFLLFLHSNITPHNASCLYCFVRLHMKQKVAYTRLCSTILIYKLEII